MNFLQSISKPWRIVAAVAGALAIVVIAFVVYSRLNAPEDSGLAEDQQLIEIRRGDLIDRVSVSGTVSFPKRENMTFGSDGVVEDVLVTEGGRVRAGEALATLDAETVARLEREVTEAQVGLRDAEKALEDFLDQPTDLAVAQARQHVVDAEKALEDAEKALEAIAEPDSLTVEDMAVKVAAAATSLRDAEKALEDVTLPDDLTIGDAEAKVAAAAASLREAEKAVEDADNPDALAVAQAEKAVLDAEKALEDLLAQPTDLQKAHAEDKVAKARSALQAANDALDDYMKLNDSDKIEDAEAAVITAEANLSNAMQSYIVTRRDGDLRIEASQKAVDDTGEAYINAFKNWLGFTPDLSELNTDYETALAEIGVDLDALFGGTNGVDLLARHAPLPEDDPDTKWSETHVAVWLNFGRTQLTPTCEPDNLPLSGVCIEDEFRATSDAYEKALDEQARSDNDTLKSVTSASSAVDAAEAELERSEEALEELRKPDDPVKLAELESAIEVASELLAEAEKEEAELYSDTDPLGVERQRAEAIARANLEEAERKLEDLRAPETIANLRAQEDLARANLEETEQRLYDLWRPLEADAERVAHLVAQANLARANLEEMESKQAELLSGVNHPDYASAAQAFEVARLTVHSKLEDLDELLQEPDAIDLAKLEAQVDAAKTALSESEKRLADASLRAPWDGFVSRVDVEAGQDVKATDIVAVLVDTGTVEVDGSVDEVDVLKITLGQEAVVTVDALEDRRLRGSISFIGAEPEQQQGGGGVVSYQVKAQLTVPDNVELPAGLSAVAAITINEARDVLLAPVSAVRGTFDAPTLQFMVDGEIVERRVSLGIADDFWTVIEQGASEGDMVVTQAIGGGALDVEFSFEEGPPEENEGPPPGERRRPAQ